MARKKTSSDVIKSRTGLASRLKQVRLEQFGEHGGPELARTLNLSARTWYNYENGVTIPGDILLRFIVATGIDPTWLLNGTTVAQSPVTTIATPAPVTRPPAPPRPTPAPATPPTFTALLTLAQQCAHDLEAANHTISVDPVVSFTVRIK